MSSVERQIDVDLDDWRPAADIIDWSDGGGPVWSRSRPLSNNTMQRIAKGIRDHCADELAPYADVIAEIEPDDVEAMQEDVVALDELEDAAAERDEPFLVEGPAHVEADGGTPMVMGQHSGARALTAEEEPLPTVTTKDRHALCVPDLYPWGLDLRYRMLQQRELAAAQGFPSDYEFVGNKGETTEQIGNAVPVNLASALVKEALTGEEPSLQTFTPDKGVSPVDD